MYKHLETVNSINKLDVMVGYLENDIKQLTRRPEEKSVEVEPEKAADPVLVEFLDGAPHLIKSLIDRVQGIRDEILNIVEIPTKDPSIETPSDNKRVERF